MKKIASILVLVFAFTLTTQAQKDRKEKRQKLSIEQHAELTVKKMTLALDLTEKQQNEIKPLLKTQAADRKVGIEKRKEARKNKTKPTADEIYAMKSKQLDNKIAFKNSMKNILNKDQFEKFEKMSKRRIKKGKKTMKKGKMIKKRKMEKENKE
mmetsp:Transcript_3001/g.3497  ORF Transcript_3001/g.3497 Transcript_3001/m.3497 type:complete len:154 (+) Transcript_3001:29-490(+)